MQLFRDRPVELVDRDCINIREFSGRLLPYPSPVTSLTLCVLARCILAGVSSRWFWCVASVTARNEEKTIGMKMRVLTRLVIKMSKNTRREDAYRKYRMC